MAQLPIEYKQLAITTNNPHFNKLCRYFNTKGGCWYGFNCHYQHIEFRPLLLPSPPLDLQPNNDFKDDEKYYGFIKQELQKFYNSIDYRIQSMEKKLINFRKAQHVQLLKEINKVKSQLKITKQSLIQTKKEIVDIRCAVLKVCNPSSIPYNALDDSRGGNENKSNKKRKNKRKKKCLNQEIDIENDIKNNNDIYNENSDCNLKTLAAHNPLPVPIPASPTACGVNITHSAPSLFVETPELSKADNSNKKMDAGKAEDRKSNIKIEPVNNAPACPVSGLRSNGNLEFGLGHYKKAVEYYSKAIILAPDNHLLYSNRSAAYLRINESILALEDAYRCIELKEDWVKGYIRLGYVFIQQKRYKLAGDVYEYGCKMCAAEKILQKEINKLKKMYNNTDVEHFDFHGAGDSFYDLGNFQMAVKYYKQAGISKCIFGKLSRVYFMDKNNVLALFYVNSALRFDKNDVDELLMKAVILIAMNNSVDGMDILINLKQNYALNYDQMTALNVQVENINKSQNSKK